MDLRGALTDWDNPDDDGSNTAHVAEHDLTPDEVDSALFDRSTAFDVSDSSGCPIAFGYTGTGRFIAIVFEILNLEDPSSSARSPLTKFPNRRSDTMKPTAIPARTAEQRAEEEAVRRQHAANPIRQRPVGAVDSTSFAATLDLLARFKTARESRGLTLAEAAGRMGIDAPALSRLETGKMLNPTLATLHKWATALGMKLEMGLAAG